MTIKLSSLFLACIFTISAHIAIYALEAPATAPASTQEEQSPNIVIPKKKTRKAMLITLKFIAFNTAKILAGLNMLPSSEMGKNPRKAILELYSMIPNDTALSSDQLWFRAQLTPNSRERGGCTACLAASLSMLHFATAFGLIYDGSSNLYSLLWKKEDQPVDKTPDLNNKESTGISIVIS